MLDYRLREIAGLVRQGGQRRADALGGRAPSSPSAAVPRPLTYCLSPDELAKRGIAYYPADRGGLATYHGPGQWVVFAVDALETLTGDPRGVRKAVTKLLEAACAVARRYERDSEIRWGAETGVWSPRGKLASVGVAHRARGAHARAFAQWFSNGNELRRAKTLRFGRPGGLSPARGWPAARKPEGIRTPRGTSPDRDVSPPLELTRN